MLKSDFHLAGGVLGNRSARRNALRLAGGVQVGEEGFDLFQLAQAIDLGGAWAATVIVQRRLRAALGIALLVEQVELQLAGHYGVVAVGFQGVDGAQQHMARVGDAGWQALGRVHADLYGRGRHPAPGQAHQAAFEWVGAAVDVAHVPHQARIFHVVTVQGQAKDGAGQRPAGLVHGQQFITVQQLAAWYAVGVEDEQFEQLDIGVFSQETGSLLYRCKVHDVFAHGRTGRSRRTRGPVESNGQTMAGFGHKGVSGQSGGRA
ncbi:hypothetical protein TCK1_4033 [Pseudomonas monteilii]|uniref:Uncharacterized protein n=1 Tax=Pseudomonas monteilii TaxID=76759 RepID=A0AAE6REY1_9PSED|nr:hypothetical protein TCK1_4033 [Pseudomonas monteilii]